MTAIAPQTPPSPHPAQYKDVGWTDSAHTNLITPPSSPPPSSPEAEADRLGKQGSRASPVRITYPSLELLKGPYTAEFEEPEPTPAPTPIPNVIPSQPSRAPPTAPADNMATQPAQEQTSRSSPRQDSLSTTTTPPRVVTRPESFPTPPSFPPRKASLIPTTASPGRILSPVPLHDGSRSGTPTIQLDSLNVEENSRPAELTSELQYHHRNSPLRNPTANASQSTIATFQTTSSMSDAQTSSSESSGYNAPSNRKSPLAHSESGDGAMLGIDYRGRSLTPQGISPSPRNMSVSMSRSPDRPMSYIDLLNTPYSQQMAQQNTVTDNAWLRDAVGSNASLLDQRKTLEMYHANVKKTNDPAIQYEFAVFMVNAAQDTTFLSSPSTDSISRTSSPQPTSDTPLPRSKTPLPYTRDDLLREAKQILSKLADRSYVFAQYYLADGYASGLFTKGKEDYSSAFPLFLSAGKHGHAEASYRTALCYEFGWGCRRDYAKAVQFFRQAASKNHPGAAVRLGKACLAGEMGLNVDEKYREGIKWLKRAAESADGQHNSGPFELGLLHTTGYGADIFKDESYAAQLFTQSADLGHAEANLRMGEAYEHGFLTCPRDPALSIHFYTGAASQGLPEAMMAVCAWYMIGAEPVLEKDEEEAYEWAKRAAEIDYPKAQYALGYFTEMGIGCRRDPLEANVWYVRAADQGDERAVARLAIIRSAETGDKLSAAAAQQPTLKKKKSWWKRG